MCLTFQVPKDLEIAFIPKTDAGLYAGFYLFSTPARLIRPVHNLRVSGAVEMIGVLEQVGCGEFNFVALVECETASVHNKLFY